MKVDLPFAFSTDVYRAGSHRPSRRTYYFKRSREIDVPESSEATAPVALRHAPFHRGARFGERVDFRRLGDSLYEPVDVAEGATVVEALHAALPDLKGIAALKATTRFAGEASTVVPDRTKQWDAEREMDKIAEKVAFIGGVLHRRTWEPVLLMDKESVRLDREPHAPGCKKFRLDEVHLLLDALRREGRNASEVRLALGSFEVVDPELLTRDLDGPAVAAAAAGCLASLGKRLDQRPRAAAQAFVALRGALLAKERAVDDLVAAMETAIEAFDGGFDDQAAKADAQWAIHLHAARAAAAEQRDMSRGPLR